MTSLKARLSALSALVFAVGLVALSSGAERAAAPPPPPPTDIGAGLTGVMNGSTAWGDYDSDGDLDILLAGHDGTNPISKIYRNDAGVFTDSGAVLTGLYFSSVAWGDYDSDGDLDVLIAGYDGANEISKIYRNDGAGGFTDIAAGLSGVALGSIAWGDYDSDGDLDVLLSGNDGTNPITKIYRNDGAGGFTDIAAGLVGVQLGAASWGDMDSDGDLDVALSGASSSGSVTKIYRNNGGTFTDIGAPLTNFITSAVAWGDYNSDGRLDLLITGVDGVTLVATIYRNDGDGAFTAIGAGLPGLSWGSVAWGDYDSDGDPDILLAGSSATGLVATVYSNDGGGAFTDAAAALTGVAIGSIAWGDYDSDGDLDILLAGNDGANPITKIYRNNSTTANTAPKAPTGLLAKRDSAGLVTFSWKAAGGSATPAAALSYDFRLSKGNRQIFTPMAAADGYRRVVQMGNTGQRRSITLSGLAKGKYKWSVQAIDAAYAGSAFANTKTFKLPGSFISIKLSPNKIRTCRKASSASFRGQIAAAPKPAVKVRLLQRTSRRGAWKKLKVVKTKASGAFVFKKVGKNYSRPVWLRAVSTLPGGAKIGSGVKRLNIKRC